MKKIKCVLLALILSVSGTACADSSADAEKIYGEKRLEYDINDSFRINLYEGELYAMPFNMDYSDSEEMPEGEQVLVFDDTGKKTRELVLKGVYGMNCWDIADGKIYTVTESTSEEAGEYAGRMVLYSSDTKTGESEEVFDFEGVSRVTKIRAVGDSIYWLGIKSEFDAFSDSIVTEGGEPIIFDYEGAVIGCYNLSTGNNTVSGIPYPECFSERNGRVIVYAYEQNKGYCFLDYADNKVLCYTNKIGTISNFEIINDELDFVFRGLSDTYNGTLSFSGADSESGIIQVDDGLWISDFSAEGNYLAVQASDSVVGISGNVYKYLADVSTSTPPIKVITSSTELSNDALFSCGFQVKTDQLAADSFALTVLSLDKSYDLALMSSRESYASDIKNKGAFYPLNDIPGIKEYIDGCFPFIKEAVTDENGDIRMLPVSVNVPAVIYNEKNCAESGITFPSDFKAFFEETGKAADISEYFSCPKYCVLYSFFNSYLSEYGKFDTEQFRTIAKLLKDNYGSKLLNNVCDVQTAFYNHNITAKIGRGLPGSFLYEEIYDNALFSVTDVLSSQQELTGDENLLAASLPTASGKNDAVCKFVCVNPNSEHLAETLLFIEKSTARFAGKKNSFSLKDKSTYDEDGYTQSLYNVYENSEIAFSVPWEIYRGDFEKYVSDGIDLEEFIAEADRKLSAYLNE